MEILVIMKKLFNILALMGLFAACTPENNHGGTDDLGKEDEPVNPNKELQIPEGAVDLGLSVYWAGCNLGANNPEEYGEYYAWGEIEIKDEYQWKNYKWVDGEVYYLLGNVIAHFTKYNINSGSGTVDNKVILESNDDAAHSKMGKEWRLPTTEEWQELVDKCTWSWSIRNGVAGYLITSNAKDNTNSIFIPAAGGKAGTVVEKEKENVVCWSSSLFLDNPIGGWVIVGSKDGVEQMASVRYIGIPVRPVYGECVLAPNDALVVNPLSFNLSREAQTIEVSLFKNVEYIVSIDSGSDWITPVGTKAYVSEKAAFNIAENTSLESRSGKITFKQAKGDLFKTITIWQDKTDSLYAPVNKFEVSNYSQTLNIEVKTNVDFEVETNADWIHFVRTKSLWSGIIELNIDTNNTFEYRTGTIVIKQRDGDLSETITIVQQQTDMLTVSPNSFELTRHAQSVDIEVKTNVDFDVVIPEEAQSWISLVSVTETKGIVNNQITLSIAQNTGSDRSATIMIQNKHDDFSSCQINIYQEGMVYVSNIVLEPAYLYLLEKEQRAFQVTIYPSNASVNEVTWSSSDESVVTIDNNGTATAVSEGVATITVTATDGSGITAECETVVYTPVVDLGLSVKWASCNLGASSPVDYGDYYAWGETSTKYYYDWWHYSLCDGFYNSLTKYNTDSSFGVVDNKTRLEAADDVAHVILGEGWRMPTHEEMTELRENCTWTWTTKSGINGYLVTGNNGASIFLPASGGKSDNNVYMVGSVGEYWSSSLVLDYPSYAYYIRFTPNNVYDFSWERFQGLSVRPVTE